MAKMTVSQQGDDHGGDMESNFYYLTDKELNLEMMPQVTPMCFILQMTLGKVYTSHRDYGHPLR